MTRLKRVFVHDAALAVVAVPVNAACSRFGGCSGGVQPLAAAAELLQAQIALLAVLHEGGQLRAGVQSGRVRLRANVVQRGVVRYVIPAEMA